MPAAELGAVVVGLRRLITGFEAEFARFAHAAEFAEVWRTGGATSMQTATTSPATPKNCSKSRPHRRGTILHAPSRRRIHTEHATHTGQGADTDPWADPGGGHCGGEASDDGQQLGFDIAS